MNIRVNTVDFQHLQWFEIFEVQKQQETSLMCRKTRGTIPIHPVQTANGATRSLLPGSARTNEDDSMEKPAGPSDLFHPETVRTGRDERDLDEFQPAQTRCHRLSRKNLRQRAQPCHPSLTNKEREWQPCEVRHTESLPSRQI